MLKQGQIIRLVTDYIGGSGGYLGDFTYRTHEEFYPCFCDLDINPSSISGTTRQRFITILSQANQQDQAKIIRGIFKRYPCDTSSESNPKRAAIYVELSNLINGINGTEVAIKPENFSDKSVVYHALQDSELLLKDRGAKSALDRVHTAIHGYLKAKCLESSIQLTRDANIIECFKALRTSHPSLKSLGEHDQEVKKVLGGLSSIIDALNNLRNRGSFAHPNDNILDNAESHLMINAAMTLLRYISERLESQNTSNLVFQKAGNDVLPF